MAAEEEDIEGDFSGSDDGDTEEESGSDVERDDFSSDYGEEFQTELEPESGPDEEEKVASLPTAVGLENKKEMLDYQLSLIKSRRRELEKLRKYLASLTKPLPKMGMSVSKYKSQLREREKERVNPEEVEEEIIRIEADLKQNETEYQQWVSEYQKEETSKYQLGDLPPEAQTDVAVYRSKVKRKEDWEKEKKYYASTRERDEVKSELVFDTIEEYRKKYLERKAKAVKPKLRRVITRLSVQHHRRRSSLEAPKRKRPTAAALKNPLLPHYHRRVLRRQRKIEREEMERLDHKTQECIDLQKYKPWLTEDPIHGIFMMLVISPLKSLEEDRAYSGYFGERYGLSNRSTSDWYVPTLKFWFYLCSSRIKEGSDYKCEFTSGKCSITDKTGIKREFKCGKVYINREGRERVVIKEREGTTECKLWDEFKIGFPGLMMKYGNTVLSSDKKLQETVLRHLKLYIIENLDLTNSTENVKLLDNFLTSVPGFPDLTLTQFLTLLSPYLILFDKSNVVGGLFCIFRNRFTLGYYSPEGVRSLQPSEMFVEFFDSPAIEKGRAELGGWFLSTLVNYIREVFVPDMVSIIIKNLFPTVSKRYISKPFFLDNQLSSKIMKGYSVDVRSFDKKGYPVIERLQLCSDFTRDQFPDEMIVIRRTELVGSSCLTIPRVLSRTEPDISPEYESRIRELYGHISGDLSTHKVPRLSSYRFTTKKPIEACAPEIAPPPPSLPLQEHKSVVVYSPPAVGSRHLMNIREPDEEDNKEETADLVSLIPSPGERKKKLDLIKAKEIKLLKAKLSRLDKNVKRLTAPPPFPGKEMTLEEHRELMKRWENDMKKFKLVYGSGSSIRDLENAIDKVQVILKKKKDEYDREKPVVVRKRGRRGEEDESEVKTSELIERIMRDVPKVQAAQPDFPLPISFSEFDPSRCVSQLTHPNGYTSLQIREFGKLAGIPLTGERGELKSVHQLCEELRKLEVLPPTERKEPERRLSLRDIVFIMKDFDPRLCPSRSLTKKKMGGSYSISEVINYAERVFGKSKLLGRERTELCNLLVILKKRLSGLPILTDDFKSTGREGGTNKEWIVGLINGLGISEIAITVIEMSEAEKKEEKKRIEAKMELKYDEDLSRIEKEFSMEEERRKRQETRLNPPPVPASTPEEPRELTAEELDLEINDALGETSEEESGSEGESELDELDEGDEGEDRASASFEDNGKERCSKCKKAIKDLKAQDVVQTGRIISSGKSGKVKGEMIYYCSTDCLENDDTLG